MKGADRRAVLPEFGLPRVVERSDIKMQLPEAARRYFPPTGVPDDMVESATLEELLQGLQVPSTSCHAKGGIALDVGTVQQGGGLALLTHLYEEYRDTRSGAMRRCYRVEGALRYRSTFTTSCRPAADAGSVMPCTAPFNSGAYGYHLFNAAVRDPSLIPIDVDDPRLPTSVTTDEVELSILRAYLGEYAVRFESQAGSSAEQSLWFHVTGVLWLIFGQLC